MFRSSRRSQVLAVIFWGLSPMAAMTQEAKNPLDATKLLSLVAGNALPENVKAVVKERGLAFTPSAGYRTLLSEAGASAEELEAVGKASARPGTENQQKEQSLKHLAAAGKLIKEQKYGEAENEVNEAMQLGGGRLEAGFVMAEALRRQEQWATATMVYTEVLNQEPDFPEAQTKLSFVLYRAGHEEEALRSAKAALRVTPNNAEAHKNAGLALEAVQKFDAAIEEFREALKIKPDYENVRYDLGLLLYDKNDFDGAITEYKKALALNPKDIDARINLALAYEKKDKGDDAIRELVEAKKLDPGNFAVRQNLGSILMEHNLSEEAVAEWRELERMAPESAVCHICLGAALYKLQDYGGAQKEDQIAIRLDPADVRGYVELGRAYEVQKRYELALGQYSYAVDLCPASVEARVCKARLLLETNHATEAMEELKTAKELEPGNPEVHEQSGKTFEALGDFETAKGEYEEALLLNKKDAMVQLELARLLEKQGDWLAAMENYRGAAKTVETATLAPVTQILPDAPDAYKGAQLRLKEHLSELRKVGKTKEATELESRLEATTANEGTSGRLDAAMEAGAEAFRAQKFVEAERSYQTAVKLGEQMQPHEGRLVMSLAYLGALYAQRKDYVNARATFERELKVAEEVHGARSPQISPVLEQLARLSLEQGDTGRAEYYALQELKVNQRNYGENSMGYSMGLMTMGIVYYTEKQYAKAEPYVLRAVKIHEALSGPEEVTLLSSKRILCTLYDLMSQAAKAEACDRELLPLMEKYYGAKNAALAPVLASEAKALRELKRDSEAGGVEKRLQTLQQPIAGTN
jgi:tetratricopeptide (TPR) repeat protein